MNASDSYDIDNDPLTYTWNWGDGSNNSTPSTKATATHQYNQPGNYIISLTVSDDKGAKKQSSTVIIVREIQTPNQLPAVWIENTNLSDDQIELTFDASDSDGNIVGFYRTIGSKSLIDGNSPNESFFSTSTQYNQSSLPDGTHTFYVRAKDNNSGLSPIVSRSFTIESPGYSETSAKINRIDPTTIKANPGEIIPIAISYKNNSNVDWKSDPGQAHYIELRSVDKNGNQANGFLSDSSWISQTRVCSFNAANVAAATQENAWFLFSGKMPENVFTGSRDIYFKLYNPEKGFFGEITQIAVENKKSEIGSSGNLDYDWNFRDGTGGWRTRIAESEGIYNNEYWIIDPEVDPITGGGIIIDSEMISFHTDQYDEIEVRAGIEHTSVSYLEVHIKMNGVFKPPIKLYHVSGQQIANSQCVFKGNIGYSGQVDCVRIDFVKGLPSNDDRVFIDYVRFNATKAQTQTQPFGNLTVSYNDNDDLFYLQYALNEHSDKLIIYYSFNYGVDWKVAHELDNISNYFKSGMLSKNIQDSKNYSSIDFKLLVINSSNNMTYTSEIEKLYYIPKPDYQEKSSEYPVSPYLYGLGSRSGDGQITLRWKKVIDSQNNDNVNYYEIDYADNDSFSNNTKLNIGNPSKETSRYETISYPINGLQDTKTYYFRVKGVNNLGEGDWSNVQNILIDIQDLPYFDTSYQEPVNGAANVSKVPVLKWRAIDSDEDNLDFSVCFGESPDNMNIDLRHFTPNFSNQNWLDLSVEYYKQLKPNTKYFWQVWVREKGRDSDYYNGAFIKSPIWSFTTIGNGSDLGFTNVQCLGEVKPDSYVPFKITVKNFGNETAKPRTIRASYIKKGIENLFLKESGFTRNNILPNEELVIEMNIKFQEHILESYGKEYDNVLIAGDGYIKFFLQFEDEQEVNTENNEWLFSIHYEDQGGPVITRFDIEEICSLYKTLPCNRDVFWARMGEVIKVHLYAQDDVMITKGVIQYRLNSSDTWKDIYSKENHYPNFHFINDNNYNSNRIEWLPHDNIQETLCAQIRVLLYDDNNNETEKISDCFPIYSNRLEANIESQKKEYTVGENLTYQISIDSDHSIERINIYLDSGSGETIFNEAIQDNNYLTSYIWTIPNKNNYVSNFCYLTLEIQDNKENSIKVKSQPFKINPNTEIPAPFNNSVAVMDEEQDPPDNAQQIEQFQTIDFVKLDSNDIAHCITRHKYKYFFDTATNEGEDTLFYSDNYYYLYYDKKTNFLSNKTNVCNKNFTVIDFEIIDNIPFVLLKSKDNRLQYYYTYKEVNSSTFVSPNLFENSNIPSKPITSLIQSFSIDIHGNDLSNPSKNILLNGYIWYLNLDTYDDRIVRCSFTNGLVGSKELVYIQNNAGGLKSNGITPVSVGNTIYYIDTYRGKLVKFDTVSLIATSCSIPFIEYSSSDAYDVAMASVNNKLILFGNGRVYELVDLDLVERAHITYTFDEEIVDLAEYWDQVYQIKTVNVDSSTTYLIIEGKGNFWGIAKPTYTDYEILRFNISSYSFSKTITRVLGGIKSSQVEASYSNQSNLFDVEHFSNNNILVSSAKNVCNSYYDIKYYASYLNLFDISTGNIIHLGSLPFKSCGNISLFKDNEKLYSLGDNKTNNTNELYEIDLNSIDSRPNQIGSLKLVKHNNKLYATWIYGYPYDGTWNYEKQQLQNDSIIKNICKEIYPNEETHYNMSNDYLGGTINYNGKFVSVNKGKIYEINNNLTVNNKIDLYLDSPYWYALFHKSFDETYISGFCRYAYGDAYIKLIKNDYSEVNFLCFSQNNDVATFDETIIFTATDPNGLAASESVSISLKQNLPIFSGLPIIIRVQKPYPDWNGYVTVAFSATDENEYTDYGSKTFTVNNMGYYTSANLNDILSGYDTAYSEITWTSVGQNQLTVSIDSNNVANIQIPDSAWSGYETITLTTAGTNSLTDLDYEKISVTPLDDIMEESDLTLIIQILKLIDQ
ncbi:MAG: hypothetical protein OMM_02885 [Candidatus Magnetoglobus multicellularis str. Araruama]|uniref:PKD domain-containing protein n=1 Tax=Candidatus Magnetoglobus multicellularis str. Araruama TaxID=890399 RepID=A0A1V1P7Z3_9BACT|nr:MAG: hypothetical protein OMM_02885 [Candidatus Magnetoglobus multicellularis str. Araruama]